MKAFDSSAPLCALAPMQDITGADFMGLIYKMGAPDFFVTEYFRVHETATFDAPILQSLRADFGDVPLCVQFIGESEYHMQRCIAELEKYPHIKMLDLNLGCPAPKVYKKNVGGGLLRDLKKAASVIKAMRKAWPHTFSVKTRLGFENPNTMPEIVKIINAEGADFMTLHGRTVKQLYRGNVDYAAIAKAVELSDIPVIANGDITSAKFAFEVLKETGARGVMFGRQAVRNPWIFRQFHEIASGERQFEPKLLDVYNYVQSIYQNHIEKDSNIKYLDGRLKKFLNFIALGVDSDGSFLREMRLAQGIDALMEVCKNHLLKNPERLFADEPFKNLCSRPNHEL